MIMQPFKNILYVYESNVEQAATLARAVSLAEKNQAVLTVVDVVPIEVVQVDMALPPGGPVSRELQAFIMADHLNTLKTMLRPYEQRLSIREDVLVGETFIEVIRAVKNNGHDLVIKPAENPSWTHMLFGSDDLHLLRECPCPIWLLKSSEKSPYQNIVAAVDFNPLRPSTTERDLNREIFSAAVRIALTDRASLHLVHAWESLGKTNKLTKGETAEENLAGYAQNEYAQHQKGLFMLVEELRESIGVDAYDTLAPSLHLPRGSAKKMITPLVAELKAELVVMGTGTRTGGMDRIIGNTAEAILDQLSCSVLAIKPPEFKTQVQV